MFLVAGESSEDTEVLKSEGRKDCYEETGHQDDCHDK